MILYDVNMSKNQISDEVESLQRNKYHSFLMRLWQTRELDEEVWYIALENPLTREVQVFKDIESLINYLTQLIEKKQVNRIL